MERAEDLKILEQVMRFCGANARGIELMQKFYNGVPPVLAKASSSSGKYHKGLDGTIPSILDHTIEMLSGLYGMRRSVELEFSESRYQMLLLATAVHDGIKYGDPAERHTVSHHPRLAAERMRNIYNDADLYNAIASHSGPWTKYPHTPLAYPDNLVHIVDMMSTAGVLRNVYKEKMAKPNPPKRP